MESDTTSITEKPSYTLWQLVLYMLQLGTFGFGGPVALVGYMYRDLVEHRGWITEADLRRAGIEPWAWIINNSVAATTVHSPLLCQRASNELADIKTVSTVHAKRYAVVPLLKEEPVGVQRLLELSRSSQ